MAIAATHERAVFACDPARSRGRLHDEAASLTRNNFRRDCDRVIHTTAFRRLKHKTQVFIVHEGDHYRTRLTHTLEVTQVARALARALGLDEDLAEAVALAHDLGHPPFGHAGERALDVCLRAQGGFDHNVQTLRILTSLEKRYPRFDGLNLSWETLEGVIKHNGPLTGPDGAPLGRYAPGGVPRAIADYAAAHGIALSGFASAEAQVAALADDIAYDAHDIDDGIRAGFFALDDLVEVPRLGAILAAIARDFPGLDAEIRVHEFIRRLIGEMIEDVIAETGRRIADEAPASADAVRQAPRAMAAFSAAMARTDGEIKRFLYARMYRHPRIVRIIADAEAVVTDLYHHYCGHPDTLPAGWLVHPGGPDPERRARRIGNFIAGMTDGYALVEHARYFDSTPELR